MFKNKSVKVILFEIFLIVLGIVGLTLGINYITNVNIKTSSLAIDDMHASVSTGNLSPVADSSINIDTTSNVLRITFEVKGASTNTKNNIIYDVALNLIADCPLKNENVKWNLYKNNSLLTTGNISPTFDKDILEDKLILTDTQEDLPSYSGTSDKYVFILWLSETCTEEDITKCDLSSVLSGETGNNTVSGNIDIRLNTGKKKPHTRVSSDTDACTILRGNGANAVKYADDGSTGDSGSGVYKVHHDEISSTDSVTGDIIPAVDDYRYYGANPDNYVCLDFEGSTTCPDKHLYRIIGSIYDELAGTNRLKVIKATALTDGTVNTFAWDMKSDKTSANIWATPTETRNNITNNYSNSTTSGSSLMIMLNSGIWWSDTTNTGKMYDDNNQSGRDVDFTNYKLSSTAKSMIGDSRYYLAGHDTQKIKTTTMYTYERTKTGTNNGRYNDSRPYYWEGKVALMYPSDYGYAAGSTCVNVTNLLDYDTSCKNSDWLFNSSYQWLMPPDSSSADIAFYVYASGNVNNYYSVVNIGGSVRPVFNLTSDVAIVGGSGTSTSPYQITKG